MISHDANGIRTLALNRPDKLNALNLNLYESIPKALNDLDDPSTITVITGTSKLFVTESGCFNWEYFINYIMKQVKLAYPYRKKFILRNICLRKKWEQVKAIFHFACIANRKKDATFFVQARDLSLAAETIWWTSRRCSSTRTRSGSLPCRRKRSWNISFHPSSILEESKTHLTTVNIFGCSWFDNYSFRDWYFSINIIVCRIVLIQLRYKKMSKNSGNGRFFSSGGDLKIYAPMFLSYSPPKIDFELAFFYLQHLQNFVSSFIDFQGKMIMLIRIQKRGAHSWPSHFWSSTTVRVTSGRVTLNRSLLLTNKNTWPSDTSELIKNVSF